MLELNIPLDDLANRIHRSTLWKTGRTNCVSKIREQFPFRGVLWLVGGMGGWGRGTPTFARSETNANVLDHLFNFNADFEFLLPGAE